MGGVWANFARVSHTEHEFTIDFTFMTEHKTPSRVWWWHA